MIIEMTNNGERNALKASREKITQPELTSNRQNHTLASERFYSLGSPADGLKFSHVAARIAFAISWAHLPGFYREFVRDLWHE